MPPDAKVPKPFRPVHLAFGRPIDVDRYRERPNDRMALRQITDEVMFEIRNLSGQEYVDEYATKKAERLPTDTAQIPTAESVGELVNGAAHDGPTAVSTMASDTGDVDDVTSPRSSAEVLRAAAARR